MKRFTVTISIFILFVILLSGCATFRSGITSEFGKSAGRNYGADKVSVLFIFSHYEQAIGYDAIPKLENERQIIRDFDDFFIDALDELSNIGSFATYTEYASDAGDMRRRSEKDSLIGTHDYTVRIKFMKKNSFAWHFLGTLASTVSAALLPVPYRVNYSASTDVYGHENRLIGSYSRSASLTKWVQSLLIFIYPFHTERLKEEQIYIDILHDSIRQIETEKILKGID